MYGEEFKCECGRTRAIDPKRVVYSEDAHERVPEVVSADLEGKNVAVIADTHTREVAGERVAQSLMDSGFRR